MTTYSIVSLGNSQILDYNRYCDSNSMQYSNSSSDSPVYSDLTPANTYMELSDSSNPSTSSSGQPFLTVEGLKDQIRFRYKSEKGAHGGLKPIVKLHNYHGNPKDVFIKVSLYDVAEKSLHVYDLTGKHCTKGIGWENLSDGNIAKFSPLSICTKKREEILALLRERKLADLENQWNQIDEDNINSEIQLEMKSLNLNCGKLCFEAFLNKKNLLCDPLFSKPICHQKSKGGADLKITRLSKCVSRCSGGESIILLCEKIRKDDVEIIFYDVDSDGEIGWEEKASFNPTDVHYQVAIPFETPSFKEPIQKETEVYIKLCRKSDGKSGEPLPFKYIPDEDVCPRAAKRKRSDSAEDYMIKSLMNEESQSSNLLNSWDLQQSPLWISGILDSSPLNFEDIPPLEVSNSSALEVDAAIDDFASLNLSASYTSTRETLFKFEDGQEFKNGIISLLRKRQPEAIFKISPMLLAIKAENGNTLLHFALLEKSDDVILIFKLLQVAPKAIINHANDSGMTPLHIAVNKGLWKVVKILMYFGANPSFKDSKGNSSMHLAVKNNQSDCLNELINTTTKKSKGKIRANVNALNYEGLAPLHISIMNESKICTELLIRAKAVINVQDGNSGKTPLHMAIERKSKLTDYLLSRPDIDKNIVDYKGLTPYSTVPVFYDPNKPFDSNKPTECCIEMSECDNSKENMEVNKKKVLKQSLPITSETEKKLCEILDSSNLWRRLGIYVMEKKKLDTIAALDPKPTKILLKELKKRHQENYSERLKDIFEDNELKSIAKELNILL